MTPDNRVSSVQQGEIKNESGRPPNLLEGKLVPELTNEEVWIYRSEGKEVLCLREGRLVATSFGAREISPKPELWTKSVFGFSLVLEMREGKKVALFSYGVGGNAADFFKNVFVIDQGLGRVKALSSPAPEVLTLLKLADDSPVFIPVTGRKGKEGGVLVTTARALKVPQNKLRIEGFLKA